MKRNTKRYIFMASAITTLVVVTLSPSPEGLAAEGKNLLGLILFVALMWVGDVMPKSVTAVLAIVMMPYLGITDSFSTTVKEFANPMLFFLVAAFALASITKRSSIPQKMMRSLFWLSGSSSGKIVAGFMIVAALMSAMMSDIAAAALVYAVATGLFQSPEVKPYLKEPEVSKLMKCVMIGIPIGSLAGGLMTPNGSPTSLTLAGTMEQLFDVSIPYLQWMFVGVPLCISTLVFAWVALMVCHRPRKIDQGLIDEFLNANYSSGGDFSKARDIKTILVIFSMLGGWVISSFVPLFNSTAVAVVGMVVIFLPGMNLLKFDEFLGKGEVPWDTVFMLGGLFSISNAMNETGARVWVVDRFMNLTGSLSPFMVLLAVCLFVAIVRAFLPAGPPLVCTASLVLYDYTSSVGLDPLSTMFCLVYWAEPTFLVPCFDAVYLVTYGSGDKYSIGDLARFGFILTPILLIFNLFFIPVLVDLSHLIF